MARLLDHKRAIAGGAAVEEVGADEAGFNDRDVNAELGDF
jgi:hypothetical protein